MARQQTIGGDGAFILGEDKTLTLVVFEGPLSEDQLEAIDRGDFSTVTVKDLTGRNIQLFIREKDSSTGVSVITRSPLADGVQMVVAGVFNASYLVNTQKATVTLTDDETNLLTRVWTPEKPNKYRISMKAMDADIETVLMYGDLIVEQTTAR
jgi:hypothetical protein